MEELDAYDELDESLMEWFLAKNNEQNNDQLFISPIGSLKPLWCRASAYKVRVTVFLPCRVEQRPSVRMSMSSSSLPSSIRISLSLSLVSAAALPASMIVRLRLCLKGHMRWRILFYRRGCEFLTCLQNMEGSFLEKKL